MELTIEQYERIQKYLDGKMMPAEKKLFMDEINTNASMKKHLAYEQELREKILFREPQDDFAPMIAPADKEEETGKNNKQQRHNLYPLRAVRDGEGKVITMKIDRKNSWLFITLVITIVLIATIAWWLFTHRPG